MINSTISLFDQSLGLASVDSSRFFVSIGPCWDSNWLEDKMTWSNSVCPDQSETEDIVVIDGTDLPQLFRWSVTRSIGEATQRGESQVTFIVSAFKLKKLTGGNGKLYPAKILAQRNRWGLYVSGPENVLN